ncbi:MAG: SDR family oxidoreductase [Hyphomicrobiales bacterium]|nr:SDR family oxidoreductase [Acidobacteriaceae bacterium]MBV9755047.1 SDR family oxidoreductase [Hyphomicrobiales bacterium]
MSRVLIVTGGSRGIGAAISRLAAGDGWDVCVNYVAHAERAKEVVESVRACGREAVAVEADVSREGDVLALFAACEEALGAPTGLVNNAGIITGFGRLDNLADEDLRRTFEVNTISYFLCAREAIKRMSTRHGRRGGVIVNISSRAATSGMPGEYVHYAASKAAVNGLTRGLALEVAAEGIRVASVSPGLIDTEIQRPERFARIAPTTPMQRAGTPDEVAEAVVWLLSDKASYVTGADLSVTGGR